MNDEVGTYCKNLRNNKTAQEYLINRGLDPTFLINNYFVGCDDNYIIMPIISDGEIKFLTRRTYTNKTPIHKHDHGTLKYFYNQDILKSTGNIIITESPIDCLSLLQNGIRAIAALGTTGYPKNLQHLFSTITKIYIIFDNDINDAGKKGAIKLANKIYRETHKLPFICNIGIDGFDINDLLKSNPTNFRIIITSIVAKSIELKPDNFERKTRKQNGIVPEKYNILEIASRYVPTLKQTNPGLWLGCCPVHEDAEPSFAVYENSNSCHCYGCGFHGNPVGLIMGLYPEYNIKEAYELLDQEFNPI